MKRYSRKVIENTIRLWEKKLLEAEEPVYDKRFGQMMDVAVGLDFLPNWVKTPEFVGEYRADASQDGDCLLELAPDSADAARICLPGSREVLAIDGNGVIG